MKTILSIVLMLTASIASAQYKLGDTTFYRDFVNSRVGINDLTPSYTLDVNGTLGVSGVTTLTGAINGLASSWSSIRAGEATISGTMTVQGNAFSVGGSTLVVSGGKVGIGTSSPSNTFVVSKAGAEGIEIIPQSTTNESRILAYSRTDSAFNTLNMDGLDLVFKVSAVEKMRVASSGNVGIGTASPAKSLEVVGGTNGDTILVSMNKTVNANKYSGLRALEYNGTDAFPLIWGDSRSDRDEVFIGGGSGSTDGATAIRLYTSATKGADIGTERVTVLANGNVGIGTKSPAASLDTVGTYGVAVSSAATSNSKLEIRGVCTPAELATYTPRGAGYVDMWVVTGGTGCGAAISTGTAVGAWADIADVTAVCE